jgi:Zn-dependent protease with chaperone function
MEPDIVNLEQGIQGLAVMSAIPVVLLGIWADSFSRRVDQLERDDPKFEREPELENVKMASLCALVSQILLFIGSSDLREHYPAMSPVIFVVAVLSQIMIQTRAENKVQKYLGESRNSIFRISLRATFCWILGVSIHVLFLAVAVGVTVFVVQRLQPTFFVGILALAATSVMALVAGITINVALAPFYFRRTFPMRKLEEAALKERVEGCFSKYGFEPPALWILELQELKITQNILVGLKGLKGKFQRSFFLSGLVLSVLTSDELEALTLNQVSHLVLQHPKKRGLLIFALISITTVLALITVFVGQGFSVEDPVVEIMGTLISFALFITSFRVLYVQTQKHETESDVYTVKNMGVACCDLISALRKLDLLIEPIPQDLTSISKSPLGFPDTERRIQLLESSVSGALALQDQSNKAA